jgi:hypothetical protein
LLETAFNFIITLPSWLLGLVLFCHVITVAWIFFDAQGRHVDNYILVTIVIMLAPIAGQCLWLLLRPRVFEMDSSGLTSADFREWSRVHDTREAVEGFQMLKQEAIIEGRVRDELLEKLIEEGDYNSAMRLASDNLQIARDIDPDRAGLYESYLRQITDRMEQRKI